MECYCSIRAVVFKSNSKILIIKFVLTAVYNLNHNLHKFEIYGVPYEC